MPGLPTLKRGARTIEPTLENWCAVSVAGRILFLTIKSGMLLSRSGKSEKNLLKNTQVVSNAHKIKFNIIVIEINNLL